MRDGPESGTPDGQTAPAHYPPRGQAWATVLILLLLYVTSQLDRNILSLFGEHVRQDLGIGDFELSLLFGPAFAVSYAIGALPLGWAMDRYSRRFVLWGGVTVWSLATVACGLSRSFTQIFVARAMVGAGEAVMVPGNQSILADSFPPDRRALAFAVYSLGSKGGHGLSMLIGGLLAALIAPAALFALPLVGELRGWQVIFIIVGLPGVLIALLVMTVPEPKRQQTTAAEDARAGYLHYLAFMRENARLMGGVHIGLVLSTMVLTCLGAWTPAFFMRVHDLSAEQVGVWLGVVLVAGPVIGAPIHGIVSDLLFRRGMRDAHGRYLSWSMLVSIFPFVAAFFVPDPWVAMLLICFGYAVFGTGAMLAPMVMQMIVPGNLRGKAASVLLLATSLAGIALGPTIVATISEKLLGGPDNVGTAIAIVVAVALPVAAFFYSLTCKPLREAYPTGA